jgi:hypothetical protein
MQAQALGSKEQPEPLRAQQEAPSTHHSCMLAPLMPLLLSGCSLPAATSTVHTRQGLEPRVIKAASEVTAKGLAKVILLGDPQQVAAEAKKLGADISGCTIVDPKVCFYFLVGGKV